MTQADALIKIDEILKNVKNNPDRQVLKDRIVKETLKSRIRTLPWYSMHIFELQVKALIEECETFGYCFWDLVDEIGGFFAVRTIIHQLLVLRNGTQKMARTPDQVKSA